MSLPEPPGAGGTNVRRWTLIGGGAAVLLAVVVAIVLVVTRGEDETVELSDEPAVSRVTPATEEPSTTTSHAPAETGTPSATPSPSPTPTPTPEETTSDEEPAKESQPTEETTEDPPEEPTEDASEVVEEPEDDSGDEEPDEEREEEPADADDEGNGEDAVPEEAEHEPHDPCSPDHWQEPEEAAHGYLAAWQNNDVAAGEVVADPEVVRREFEYPAGDGWEWAECNSENSYSSSGVHCYYYIPATGDMIHGVSLNLFMGLRETGYYVEFAEAAG